MLYRETKRRSRAPMGRVMRVIWLVGAFASPFCLVRRARAFDFSKTLDIVAGNAGLPTGEAANDLPSIVGEILYAAIVILGVVFILLAVFSGIKWMTAGGNQEKVEEAKKALSGSAIGAAVTIMAYAIVTFVFKMLL